MKEQEVIIVDQINPQDYDSLIEECIRYAIISLPFTVDRMRIPNETRRALNIAKGKIAESLFHVFCKSNNIKIDFDSTATPFWKVDNRDFIINENEWDIKNNFIYHKGDTLESKRYIDLPALVPNKYYGDQWSKRNDVLINNSKSTTFLFTFLKNDDLINGKRRGKEFLEFFLTEKQEQFLRKLYKKYRGNPQKEKPFSEEWFWGEMEKYGEINSYTINFRPSLIITGFASYNHWELFNDIGPFDRNNHFQHYLKPNWYTKAGNGSCNFMNNTLWIKITNAATPVSNLPAFLSLFPGLKGNINCARLSK